MGTPWLTSATISNRREGAGGREGAAGGVAGGVGRRGLAPVLPHLLGAEVDGVVERAGGRGVVEVDHGASVADLGIYIHFPWCRNLCSYCDFPVVVARPGNEPPHDAYADAILAELDPRAGDLAGRRLVSIYLGGGTPSLWREDAIARVLAAAAARSGAALDGLEVTIEANPTDCTPARMAAWRAAGISRVSIGVQSLDAGELVTLGRDHRMGDGKRAVEAALA